MSRSHIYVLSAALGFSFILVFSTILKNRGMSSLEQLFFRLSFGLLILLLILVSRRQFRLFRAKDAPFFVAIGTIYSLFTLSGMSSIAFGTSIAVAVALIYTQPIHTAIISSVTGRERISAPILGAILLGVSGVFLLTGPEIMLLQLNLGLVLPILGGFYYAIYLWLKRQASEKQQYTPYQLLFNTFLVAIPIQVVTWLVLRNLNPSPLFTGVIIPDAIHLLLLFGFAGFSTVFPYTMLNFVRTGEISPTLEGLLLLGDPLLHMIWAIVLFSQYVMPIQYVGAALILSSAAVNLKLTATHA